MLKIVYYACKKLCVNRIHDVVSISFGLLLQGFIFEDAMFFVQMQGSKTSISGQGCLVEPYIRRSFVIWEVFPFRGFVFKILYTEKLSRLKLLHVCSQQKLP